MFWRSGTEWSRRSMTAEQQHDGRERSTSHESKFIIYCSTNSVWILRVKQERRKFSVRVFTERSRGRRPRNCLRKHNKMKNDENVMKAITNVKKNRGEEWDARASQLRPKCVKLNVMECFETRLGLNLFRSVLINWRSSSLSSAALREGKTWVARLSSALSVHCGR